MWESNVVNKPATYSDAELAGNTKRQMAINWSGQI